MKILVGLSGGLDSTYAALLLKEQGHTVEGAVLDMHGYTETDAACTAAKTLGIPFHVISCRDLFDRVVIEDFCTEYLQGRTPNPCVVCNDGVKFRVLYEAAKQRGFDRFATGHYARVVVRCGRPCVRMAKDGKKDQSYMLYRVPPEILSKLLLPLGELTKEEIKARARLRSLAVADRAESQDICFVRGESYADFIERRCGTLGKGNFVDDEGRVLGEHKGIVHYTVGQRKGLGVSAATRLFVQRIDSSTGDIVLSPSAPCTTAFALDRVVFSGASSVRECEGMDLKARVRYSAPLVRAHLFYEGETLCARVSASTCAVTPGQSVVFYLDEAIVLGGIIKTIL